MCGTGPVHGVAPRRRQQARGERCVAAQCMGAIGGLIVHRIILTLEGIVPSGGRKHSGREHERQAQSRGRQRWRQQQGQEEVCQQAGEQACGGSKRVSAASRRLAVQAEPSKRPCWPQTDRLHRCSSLQHAGFASLPPPPVAAAAALPPTAARAPRHPLQAPTGSRSGMPVGSRGVLISCVTSKELQAGREAADLFFEVRPAAVAAAGQPVKAFGAAAGCRAAAECAVRRVYR